MTAPMPSEVSDTGPSVLRRACAGSCDSLINLSIDLRAKSCPAYLPTTFCPVDDCSSSCSLLYYRIGARNRLFALRLAARQFLHFCLLCTPWLGAFALWCGLLTCCALNFFALYFVCDAFCICHESVVAPILFSISMRSCDLRKSVIKSAQAGQIFPPASSYRDV